MRVNRIGTCHNLREGILIMLKEGMVHFYSLQKGIIAGVPWWQQERHSPSL